MAGPIRTLLERRPLRNAVRSLLGMQPRYGMGGIEAVAATDAMQDADLDAAPSRRQARRDVDNTPYQSRTTALPPAAPSPEARAVSMARVEDGQRRQQTQRQADGIAPAPAPQQPRPPETGGFALTMPIADTGLGQPNPMIATAQRFENQANALRQEADEISRNPAMRNPNSTAYMVLASRANALRRQAQEYDAQVVAIQDRLSSETHVGEMTEKAQKHARELAQLQHPPDSVVVDNDHFTQLVSDAGIDAAALAATDSVYAQAKQPLPAVDDKAYQSRLLTNKVRAASVAVGIRARSAAKSRKSPFTADDPLIAELAQIALSYSADDAAKRSQLVTGIVSGTQSQTNMNPQVAGQFARVLTNLIEEQISRSQER